MCGNDENFARSRKFDELIIVVVLANVSNSLLWPTMVGDKNDKSVAFFLIVGDNKSCSIIVSVQVDQSTFIDFGGKLLSSRLRHADPFEIKDHNFVFLCDKNPPMDNFQVYDRSKEFEFRYDSLLFVVPNEQLVSWPFEVCAGADDEENV